MKRASLLIIILSLILSFSVILSSCNDTGDEGGSGSGGTTDQGGTGDEGGSGSGNEGGGSEDDGGNQGGTEGGTEGGEEGGNEGEGEDEGGEPSVPVLPACATPAKPSWNPNTETLSWREVEGAASYVLKIDGRDIPITSGTSYKVSNLDSGDHTVTVRAIGDSEHSDSAESEAHSFKTGWSGWIT